MTRNALLAALALIACLWPAVWPAPGHAQNLFAVVARVNDQAITRYELNQRVLLLKALRTIGDLEKEALERLINERIQFEAASRAGITISEEQIAAGIEEFAARTTLSGEQFLQSLAKEGVARESFRDFVRASLAWRELVRSKFTSQAAVSDAEVDRALSLEGTLGSVRVLISEIFLPINTPENEAIARPLAEEIARIRTFDGFAEAARKYSAAQSRERGGRVANWVEISNLPPALRTALLKMKPGEVTGPIELPNALALFQLRAIAEADPPAPRNPGVEYAAFYISGGRSADALAQAEKLRNRVDTCNDLYGVAKGMPPEVLERQELPLSKVPADVALELAKLDPGEVSTELTRANGQTLVFLMLCKRVADIDAEISRDAIKQRLSNEKLTTLADGLLDELRAEATIVLP